MDSLAKGFFAVIIITAIQLYFWCCIFSLYQQFNSDESFLPINNSIQMSQQNTDLPPSYAEVSIPMTKEVYVTVKDYSSIP